jgi:hypothetical protein
MRARFPGEDKSVEGGHCRLYDTGADCKYRKYALWYTSQVSSLIVHSSRLIAHDVRTSHSGSSKSGELYSVAGNISESHKRDLSHCSVQESRPFRHIPHATVYA